VTRYEPGGTDRLYVPLGLVVVVDRAADTVIPAAGAEEGFVTVPEMIRAVGSWMSFPVESELPTAMCAAAERSVVSPDAV
jgi:hypothetical protein